MYSRKAVYQLSYVPSAPPSVRTALRTPSKCSLWSHTLAPLFFSSLDSQTLTQAPSFLVLVGGNSATQGPFQPHLPLCL